MAIVATTPAFQDMLNRAVLGLFRGKNSAFLTTIYCGLKFSWRDEIPTACTNGRFLRINPHWYLTLDEASRLTVLAHELWHVAFMHMFRKGPRQMKRWNRACDYAENLMLVQHGYTYTGAGGWLMDWRFQGMTAEQIYDILEKENDPDENPFDGDFTLKDPDEPDDADDQVAEDVLEAEVKQLIIRANTMQDMSGKPGSMPGEMDELIKRLLNPQIPWGHSFARWFTEKSDEGVNWKRPNRRFADIYLPSRGGHTALARLMFAIDASYSMSPAQLCIANSEMKGVQEKYQPESMLVVAFDTKIQKTWEFDRDHPLEALDIPGRGGTNMQCVFDLAAKTRPNAIVMFSDMECPIPESIGIPVLWVCFDDPDWTPPYGDVIHVDSRSPTTA